MRGATRHDYAERKGTGAYFTPAWLADYLAGETLRPLTGWPVIVLDPAVGHGALLLAAARVLANALRRQAGARGQADPGEVGALAQVVPWLRGWDVAPRAVDATRRVLAELVGGAADGLERAVTVADALSPDLAAEPVDVVLANPPWGVRLSGAVLDHWQRVVGRRSPDSFEAFVHRVPSLLKPGGRAGFILPEIVLLRDYERTRRLLLDRLPPESVLECGHVFDGVHMGAAALVCGTAGDAVSFRVLGEGGAWTEASRVDRPTLAAQPGARFNRRMTPAAEAWLAELHRRGRPLGRVITLREGIHSGNARAEVFACEPAPGRAPLVVRHRPDGSARLPWDGHWFDPGAYAALAAPKYARTGDLARHRGPKLAVPRTTPRLLAYLDDQGLLLSNNFFVGTGAPEQLSAAWVWLNSELATVAWRLAFPRDPRLFPEAKINHLNQLPLPDLPPAPVAAARQAMAAGASLAEVRARCDEAVREALGQRLVSEGAALET